MECGVPCVSFDIDVGPREIIQTEENGILIKNRNIEEMAQKILELLEDENKWNNISRNSLESVKKYYSDNVAKEWIKIIEK